MAVTTTKKGTEVILHKVVWVMAADMDRAKLLCCGLTMDEHCYVEACAILDNTWPGHDHANSSPQWKNSTITFGVESDERQEDIKRFLHEIADWLEQQMKKRKIARLETILPPRMAGVFRKSKFAKDHVADVVQHQGDLVNLPLSKLARHKVITQLVTEKSDKVIPFTTDAR